MGKYFRQVASYLGLCSPCLLGGIVMHYLIAMHELILGQIISTDEAYSMEYFYNLMTGLQ